MPPKPAAPDRGMLVLEQKLSILRGGPGHTRRNPALDVLTGRVPDERLQSLQAGLLNMRNAPSAQSAADVAAQPTADSPTTPNGSTGLPGPTGPTAMVLPVAAIRMAAVARSQRQGPSPWLQASGDGRPRLKLITPPPSRWLRVPWLGALVLRFRAEYRPYRPTVRSRRVHPAS